MLTIFYYELEFTPSRIAFSDDSSAALEKTEGGEGGGRNESDSLRLRYRVDFD